MMAFLMLLTLLHIGFLNDINIILSHYMLSSYSSNLSHTEHKPATASGIKKCAKQKITIYSDTCKAKNATWVINK